MISFVQILEFVSELSYDEVRIDIKKRRILPQMRNKVHRVGKEAEVLSGIGVFSFQGHEIKERNAGFLRRFLQRDVLLFSCLP